MQRSDDEVITIAKSEAERRSREPDQEREIPVQLHGAGGEALAVGPLDAAQVVFHLQGKLQVCRLRHVRHQLDDEDIQQRRVGVKGGVIESGPVLVGGLLLLPAAAAAAAAARALLGGRVGGVRALQQAACRGGLAKRCVPMADEVQQGGSARHLLLDRQRCSPPSQSQAGRSFQLVSAKHQEGEMEDRRVLFFSLKSDENKREDRCGLFVGWAIF